MPPILTDAFYWEIAHADLPDFTTWLNKKNRGTNLRSEVTDDGVCKVWFDTDGAYRSNNLKRSFLLHCKRNVTPFVLRAARGTDELNEEEEEPAMGTGVTVLDMATGFNVGGKLVRKTEDVPSRVSVYDLIEVVTGQPAKAAIMIFKRLKKMSPEVTTMCGNLMVHKVPGPGQRNTPVTDARGVVTIINLLPGRAAAQFRASCADVMVRFMGGDLTLIAEIQRNANLQAQLPADNPMRMFGEDVESRYKPNVSTLQLESGDLTGFDGPGVYFILYGDKVRYNLAGVPENAKVVGYGHAVIGAKRCGEHNRLTGPTTRVLCYVPTPFDFPCERQLENRLKAMGRIVHGKIDGTPGVMREQFYVQNAEELDEIMRSVRNDADTFLAKVQKDNVPLLLEQEKTKQMEADARKAEAETEADARKAEADADARKAEADADARKADADARKAEADADARKAEADADARKAEASASVRIKELELQILLTMAKK